MAVNIEENNKEKRTSPVLSVVMANFNHGKYIGKAIESIISQSCKAKEFIIVDDGSKDNSVEIIKHFVEKDASIHLICNEKNMGVGYSSDIALKKVSGDYIFGMSADDYFLPGFFEKSMKMLKKYPEAGFCCSDSKTIKGSCSKTIINRRKMDNHSRYFSPDELVELMRKRIMYFSGFGTIVKASSFKEIGGLPDLLWSADMMYTTIMALRYGMCFVPEVFSVQLLLKESFSEQGVRDWKRHKKVVKNILDLLKTHQYADVLPKFKQSCALANLGIPLIRVLAESTEHWDYLSPNLVKLILWQEFRKTLRRYSPAFINKFIDHLRDRFLK